MKRAIVFSLAYYPSHISGAEIAIKEITDRIDPNEIEFHVVTLRFDVSQPKEEKLGNVYVHRVGSGGSRLAKLLYLFQAAYCARRLHKGQPIDLIWAMMTYMLVPTTLAQLFGVRVPHVYTIQDGDSYEKVFKRFSIKPFIPLVDRGIRHAAVIQSISSYLATWPKLRGGQKEVVVISNGASLASGEAYPEEELAALRAQVGKKEGDIFLLTVARLVHQKAQDTVIRALPLLPENIKYLIVGEGENKEMLQVLAKELGVTDRVMFTGHVDRTMTAKYRRISDIFVHPSRSEGQGIALLSTMLSGLPIIATQVGGICDYLFDAKRNPDKPTTGWAVDVDSPEQIAITVKEILANSKMKDEVVATAITYAKEHFDWDKIAQRMQKEVFEVAVAS